MAKSDMTADRQTLILTAGRGFAYVALWQWMAFAVLLLLVWVNELMSLPYLLYGAAKQPPDITRGCLATAGVLLTGIIAVGNTYLQQQRIMKGMLAVCSYCHKIRLHEDVWKELEMFIHDYSKIAITHSICPDCYKQEIENVHEANADAAP